MLPLCEWGQGSATAELTLEHGGSMHIHIHTQRHRQTLPEGLLQLAAKSFFWVDENQTSMMPAWPQGIWKLMKRVFYCEKGEGSLISDLR